MNRYQRLAQALIYGGGALPETTASRALRDVAGADEYQRVVIEEWADRLKQCLSSSRIDELTEKLDTLRIGRVVARTRGGGGGSGAEIVGDLDQLPEVDVPGGTSDDEFDLLIAEAQDELNEVADELSRDPDRESLPSAGQQADELRTLAMLRWTPSLSALAMLRAIGALPMGRRGSGRMHLGWESAIGAQVSESTTPRAMGRKSAQMRKLHITNGRRCGVMRN